MTVSLSRRSIDTQHYEVLGKRRTKNVQNEPSSISRIGGKLTTCCLMLKVEAGLCSEGGGAFAASGGW
jgi:hypothetical protein